MNQEVHIIPIGPNSWAVDVGKTSYRAFDTEEKALQFGQQMAARTADCKVIVHDVDGNMFSVDDNTTRH
jgi:hypothetical protein